MSLSSSSLYMDNRAMPSDSFFFDAIGAKVKGW